MKELQFKTGGRRIRIEDFEALQDSVKGASAFYGASGEFFVVTGCVVTVSRAVRNPSYGSLTGFGSKVWDNIQLSISDGYVWMDGKLRKVEGKTVNISNINETVYIVPKDVLTGGNIVYFDGTVGQQFFDYGAEIIVSTKSPEDDRFTYIALTPKVDVMDSRNPSSLGYKFLDFKSGFLAKLALPRAGGAFDNKAKISLENTTETFNNKISLSGDSIAVESYEGGHKKRAVEFTSDGFTFFDEDGDMECEIGRDCIWHTKIMSDYFCDREGHEVDAYELGRFFEKLSKNVIQFNENNIKLTWGVEEDGDERCTTIQPHQITVRNDDDNTVITGSSVTTNQVCCELLYGGFDMNNGERWIEARKLFTTDGGSLDNGASLVMYAKQPGTLMGEELYLGPGAVRLTKTKENGTSEVTSMDSLHISSTDIVGVKFYASGATGTTAKPGVTVDIPVGDKILKVIGGIVVGYHTVGTADPDQEVL